MKIAHIVVAIAVTLCGLIGYSLGTGWIRVGPPDHSNFEAPPKNPTNADSSHAQLMPIGPNKGSLADPAVLPAALSIPPLATAINAMAQSPGTHTHNSSTPDAVPAPPVPAPPALRPGGHACPATVLLRSAAAPGLGGRTCPSAAAPAPRQPHWPRQPHPHGSRTCLDSRPAPQRAHRPLPFCKSCGRPSIGGHPADRLARSLSRMVLRTPSMRPTRPIIRMRQRFPVSLSK